MFNYQTVNNQAKENNSKETSISSWNNEPENETLLVRNINEI